MSGYYPPPYSGGGSFAGGPSSTPAQPDLTVANAAVSRMTVEELRGLLDDEDKCDRFVKGLDQIRSLYSEKEMLMASNKSLAEYNLSQEQPLTDARCRLQEKHRETRRMAEKVKNLRRDVEEKGGSMDPDTVLGILQAEGAKTEEESDALADKFIRKDCDVDEFLESFMEKRKLAHMRRIKIDKMKELVEQERRNNGPSASAAPYPATGGGGTPTRRAPLPPAATYNLPGQAVPPPPSNWGMPPAYPPQGMMHMGGAAAPPPAPGGGGSNLPYPIHPVGMPSGPGY